MPDIQNLTGRFDEKGFCSRAITDAAREVFISMDSGILPDTESISMDQMFLFEKGSSDKGVVKITILKSRKL